MDFANFHARARETLLPPGTETSREAAKSAKSSSWERYMDFANFRARAREAG
jgi:hypothetical protein